MTTFDSMVAEFRRKNAADERNAIHEVMQQIALAGLARGGFFQKAAFISRIISPPSWRSSSSPERTWKSR